MGTKRSCYSLDEDLIVEILSRLPVKSLMRFSCASKEWYSLTRNSYLINIHLRRADSNLSLLTNEYDRDKRLNTDPKFGISMLGDEAADLVSIDLPILSNSSKFTNIVGSSNGLVCLVARLKKKRRKFMDSAEIIIWNPATKQFRSLPKPVLEENFHRFDRPTLGFGFSDDNTDDYKLVNIFHKQVQVFTRSTNSWREVEGKGYPSCKYCYGDFWVSLKGVLYWSAWTDRSKGRFVLSFNLRDEVFHVIQLPSGNDWYSRLLLWKNSLAIVSKNQVWAAKTDDSDESGDNNKIVWTKQFSIDFSISRCEEVFGIWKDQVLIRRHNSRYDRLYLYDPITKERGKLLRKPDEKNYYGYGQLVNYVESLALV
ncbi:putative F-box protein [Rosa sericea]